MLFASWEMNGCVRRAAFVLLLMVSVGFPTFAQRRTSAAARAGSSSLLITSEPNAIVWIDEIRRGITDANGRLELKKILPGRHTVRVRAIGFKEATAPLLRGTKNISGQNS